MFRMYIVTQLPPLAKAKGGSSYNVNRLFTAFVRRSERGGKPRSRDQSSRVASSKRAKSQSLCCSRVRDELSSTSASGA